MIDEQAIRIKASRDVATQFIISSNHTLTVHQIDPTKVNVSFFEHKNQVMIRGPITPGEEHLQRIPDRVATDKDKARYPLQYQAFLENRDQSRTGTPLDLIFPSNSEKINNYYKANIYNIEQLADINEAAIASNKDISVEDKKIAQRYIRYQSQEKILQYKDERIAELEHENASLRAQVIQLQSHKPRQRL